MNRHRFIVVIAIVAIALSGCIASNSPSEAVAQTTTIQTTTETPSPELVSSPAEGDDVSSPNETSVGDSDTSTTSTKTPTDTAADLPAECENTVSFEEISGELQDEFRISLDEEGLVLDEDVRIDNELPDSYDAVGRNVHFL